MVDQNGAYLFRKRGIYYFSKRIPSDLKHLYRVERLIHSLRTKCDRKAKSQALAMLLHTFDRDPDDPHKFVWTEVYRKSDDFLFHADNPAVLGYVEKHAELATHFSIEIYGDVSNEVIEKINSREIPLKHFATTSVGYIRSERFA